MSELDSELRYTDAVAELKAILDGIENEHVDLDDLSIKVERAASLIRFCRDRIENTEMRVRQVLSELESDKETS